MSSGLRLRGNLERRHDGHPARAADQQPLLAGEAAGHVEGVLVGDRDHLVGDRGVVRRRPEVLADALHEVGTTRATRVHRALRVGSDDPDHAAAGLLEEATGAGDRPAGAGPRDEVGDAAVGLLPQLRTSGLVVRQRIVGVGVLVGLPGTRDSRARRSLTL